MGDWRGRRHALRVQRLYRRPPARVSRDGIRLLALLAPGDFMANTPLEFLLEDSDVTLDMYYIVPGTPLTQPIPDHDVAFVAVGSTDESAAVLREIEEFRSVLAAPGAQSSGADRLLSQDGAGAGLASAPGLAVPKSARIGREILDGVGQGTIRIDAVIDERRVSDHCASGRLACRRCQARRSRGGRRVSAGAAGARVLRRAVHRLSRTGRAVPKVPHRPDRRSTVRLPHGDLRASDHSLSRCRDA